MKSESTLILPITPQVTYQSIQIHEDVFPDRSQSVNSPRRPSMMISLYILSLICFIAINNYFCYHEPSAIASEYESYYHLSTKQFGTLFTIYSAPNVVLVFFSGQFIDRYGLQQSSLLFNYVILAGMLLAALTPVFMTSGSTSSSSEPSLLVYLSLLLSRLILGLGGESIVACSSTMIAKWFSTGDYLNTAMAVNQAGFQLFGSAAAFYILPHANNIILSQWITVGVCVISLVANYKYNAFEVYYDDYLNEQQVILQQQQELEVVEKDIQSKKTSSSIFGVLFEFPLLFYILLLHISLVSPILYTFTAFGPMYLQQTFPSCSSPTVAGNAISLLYMSIVAAPFTGIVIDYYGYRSYVQFVASCNIPLIFMLLHYGYLDPNLAMCWMGVIYSITESNSFALIALIVPQELTGTAFGILGCCISIALLVEPAAVGVIFQYTGSFKISIWIFFYLTLIGSIFAFIMILYDRLHGNIVSKSNRP
jgi:MFS family permease